MPIYHDYHGDSRSSSISTWDQIQLSLKSLLPSYEPILCDSAVVASLLSNPICTDFEHIATPHEIQDENYSDPEYPEIHKSDQAESEPEAEIDIEDATLIRIATKFTNPDQEAKWNSENSTQLSKNNTTIQANSNSKFQIATEIIDSVTTQNTSSEFTTRTTPQLYSTKQNQRGRKEIVPGGSVTGWIEGDWQSEFVIIGDCLRSARKEGREEELWVPLAESPRPWLSESGQNDRVAIGAEDAAVSKGKVEITDLDLARAESVQRPPPKPPHLNSYTAALGDSSTAKILVAGRIGAMDDGGEQDTSSNVVSAEEMQPWVTAVVEGELTTGAEVGTSTKEKRRTIVAGVNATMTDEGIWTRQLRWFLSLNLTPLLAAIFLWDRGGGGSHGIYGAAEVSFSSSRKRQESMGTALTTPCDAIPTTAEERRRSWWVNEEVIQVFRRQWRMVKVEQ
ncbi:hypothetical protein PIB30_024817 [Stylosanthes scabra]|uniref:Uncharacterized protein n=1 Tax=Stylosanthes scabra TaxID=79078 RepID=A0ABU6XA32_9FABA|nr:hypothetical protein [Stylosanthes scabra]